MGHVGDQFSHAPGRPVLHLVSSSRRPRQVTIVGAMSSLTPSSFVRAVSRSFVPACACSGAPRAGAVKAGRRTWLTSVSAFPGHALAGPSTVPGSRRSGRHRTCPHTSEFALLVENRPGNASKLVGEGDRQHVVVQSFLGVFDPRLEPVAFPAVRPHQHDPGRLHEGRAGTDCPASISSGGSCGLRSRSVWAPVQAKRRSHAPSRMPLRCRSPPP